MRIIKWIFQNNLSFLFKQLTQLQSLTPTYQVVSFK
jgi:hypothetical protein